MFFRFIKTFERMVLFYGRQLNGTIRASLWSGQRRIANSGVIAPYPSSGIGRIIRDIQLSEENLKKYRYERLSEIFPRIM